MDSSRTSPRKTRSPSPRRRVLHRDPFNLSFSNTAQHNEGTHRSQRQYFIPQKEIIKDWTPRDLTARRAFLATYAHYNNTRDPGFVCPELENSWKARAGVEGASYSHQVHVYRRYMANTGRIVGVADSAQAGSTPFASACTQVGQRIISDKPAHQYCNDGRGTGTFHASNGLIHYNAENPSLIAKMGNKQSCGHDHSPIRHDTYVKAHEREMFAHNATLIPWKQHTLGKSMRKENYPEYDFSGSMDTFPSVSRHGSARTGASTLNHKKEPHMPALVLVDGGENGVNKDNGVMGDVSSEGVHREVDIDRSSMNTTTTAATPVTPGTTATAATITSQDGTHDIGMGAHAGMSTVTRVHTSGPIAGRRATIGNNHSHSGKMSYFPENSPARGLGGGVDGRGDPRDWEPEEYGRYHPLYARSMKISDGIRIGTRRPLIGTGTGAGKGTGVSVTSDGRKGHVSNGSNVNGSDGGRRVRRERTGIELGWAKSRGKIPDDDAATTAASTNTTTTTTTTGADAGMRPGTGTEDAAADEATAVTGGERGAGAGTTADTSADAGAGRSAGDGDNEAVASDGGVKKKEKSAADMSPSTDGEAGFDSNNGSGSADDGSDGKSDTVKSSDDNKDNASSESPVSVVASTNGQAQEHISFTATTAITTPSTPTSPTSVGNGDVNIATDATDASVSAVTDTISTATVEATAATADVPPGAGVNPDTDVSTTNGVSAVDKTLPVVTSTTNHSPIEANDSDKTNTAADNRAIDTNGNPDANNSASTALASPLYASTAVDANASGAVYHDKDVDNTSTKLESEDIEPEVPPQDVVESVDPDAM